MSDFKKFDLTDYSKPVVYGNGTSSPAMNTASPTDLPEARYENITGFACGATHVQFAAGAERGYGQFEHGNHGSVGYLRAEAERFVKEGVWRKVAAPADPGSATSGEAVGHFKAWAATNDGNCNSIDLREYSADSYERRTEGMTFISPLVERDWTVWQASRAALAASAEQSNSAGSARQGGNTCEYKPHCAYCDEDRDEPCSAPSCGVAGDFAPVAERAAAPASPILARAANLEGFYQSEPLGYAQFLAWVIWRDNYKEVAPDFEILGYMAGVLSQIDNMVSGMGRKDAAPASVPGLYEAALTAVETMRGCAASYIEDHKKDVYPGTVGLRPQDVAEMWAAEIHEIDAKAFLDEAIADQNAAPEVAQPAAQGESIDTPDFQKRFAYMLRDEYAGLIADINAWGASQRRAGQLSMDAVVVQWGEGQRKYGRRAGIEEAAALYDTSPHAEEFRVNIAESTRALKSLATLAPTAGEAGKEHGDGNE